MKYEALISVEGDTAADPALIRKVFAAEGTQIKENAYYTIKKTKKAPGRLAFSIKAEDSVGLKTALNSIAKVLAVIEKVKKIQ